jgi:Rrf2 family transcriptional regulator, iron-sulfur cluster assembly transcription factor
MGLARSSLSYHHDQRNNRLERPVRLPQTAEYALRAVLEVASIGPDRPVRVSEIAEALDVPRNYLSKTLHVLARRGVLVSTRGPGGGFQLAVPPERLTLDRIVGPFDTVQGRDCLLGRQRCSDLRPCVAHERWTDVSRRLSAFFTGTTVADLLREEPDHDALDRDASCVPDAPPRARGAARPRPTGRATARRPSRSPWPTCSEVPMTGKDLPPPDRDEAVPLGQRLYDNVFLLLGAGIVVMVVVYTGWGLWEILNLPRAPLPW